MKRGYLESDSDLLVPVLPLQRPHFRASSELSPCRVFLAPQVSCSQFVVDDSVSGVRTSKDRETPPQAAHHDPSTQLLLLCRS